LVAVLGLLTAADFVNAHYEYAPQIRDVADIAFPGVAYQSVKMTDVAAGHMRHPHGGVTRIALPDGHDGFGPSHELVYVPRAYFTSPTTLPVVYLLHGSPGSAEDWFRAAHAASVGSLLERQGTPAILVAPEMSKSWTQDSECVDGKVLHAESHLLDVILPVTQERLRLRTDREGRILAGNSAGGFCALNLGLRHRDLFNSIVDLSGYTKPTYNHGLEHLFGNGPNVTQEISANSPDIYAANLPISYPVNLWFDTGSADKETLNQETALIHTLSGRPDMTTHITVRPGGHTYGVWRPGLRNALALALKNISVQPAPATGPTTIEEASQS
jgi:enterochelin esterase-like enzyme